MLKRLLLAVPAIGIFVATGLIFMAARAPQTWATHWSLPKVIARATGESEFGAVPRAPGRWDLLWVDDDRRKLIYSPASRPGTRSTSVSLDHGDVMQPTLLRIGNREIGAWIRNRNGATDLMAAILTPLSQARVFRLLDSVQPIEHPYLFAGGKSVGLVFSWQRHGNYDLFLTSFPAGDTRHTVPKRLTKARYYSFYPRAVSDRDGNIDVLHLENCCQEQIWNVVYDRFDRKGRHLGPTRVLYRITSLGQGQALPSQWAEALSTDEQGAIWGAFGADQGAMVFKASPAGKILEGPRQIDPAPDVPQALALLAGPAGGYLFWQQPFDLGQFLNVQQFDGRLRSEGGPERAVYESASQTNPKAIMRSQGPEVLWQSVGEAAGAHFEVSYHRKAVTLNVAQRLGLGLGNPWSDLALLLVGSVGVAALSTVGNMLIVFGLTILGLVLLRLLRPIPGRWAIYVVLLSAALYGIFVAPGGPLLFLGTMPSMGLDPVPFGLVAGVLAFVFLAWMGLVALRRVEDLYRAGSMAVLGIYFFAFIEAIVFVQQRLGYI